MSNINSGVRTLDRWFNTDGFEKDPRKQPAAFQARQFPQRVDGARADVLNRMDANIQRSFQLREGVSLQLRLDTLNLANHTQFDPPNLDPTSSNFGKITSNSSSTNAIPVDPGETQVLIRGVRRDKVCALSPMARIDPPITSCDLISRE